MTFLPHSFASSRWKATPLFVGMAGVILLGGCGKAPEPAATAEAAPAETTPEPAATPTSGKPSLVVQPPAAPKAEPAAVEKIVYVIEGFEAVSTDGTHQIPTGAEVRVLAEENDEYLISYGNLSVRTPKAYFSETRIEEAAAPEPEPQPEPAAPTPDAIPMSADTAPAEPAATPPAAEPVAVATPGPEATPDPAMAADEAKTQELMGQIRSIDDEIRATTDQVNGAPAVEKAKAAAKIEKLKKRRDALSENLTKVAKP
jgi:hypothetical protein